MKRPIVINKFYGGISSDLKLGTDASFGYSRSLDFRKSPMQLTVLPKTTKESGSIVDQLVTNMVQLPSGKIVAIGETGGVFVRTTAGSWSKHATSFSSTAFGMYYDMPLDMIFIPSSNGMNIIKNADGRFGGTFTPTSSIFDPVVDTSGGTSANTYTTLSSVTEGATNLLTYLPNIDPLYSVKLYVTTKGSGDLVLTMHDPSHNVMATVTKSNASITDGALNEFVFSSPVRVKVSPSSGEYHFHINHTGGTSSTIGCTTASDFSTVQYEIKCNYLTSPNNGYHPVDELNGYILVGNGRYVAQWNPVAILNPTTAEFDPHRLRFPADEEVTSFTKWDEYIVIATERRGTSATNEFQTGMLYLWDGYSDTYNRAIKIEEGSPYSLTTHKNTVFYIANGTLWAWSGGDPVKVQQYPNTDSEFTSTARTLINHPNMMAVRNGVLLTGFPSQTTSTTIEHGVYSYGQRDRKYPYSFGLSYIISDGSVTTDGTLRLGCVRSYGEKIFISWRNGSNYGVDVVDSTSAPFTSSQWQSLRMDNGRLDKQKTLHEIKLEYIPTSGTSIDIKYKIDRGSWTVAGTATNTDTRKVVDVNKRYK